MSFRQQLVLVGLLYDFSSADSTLPASEGDRNHQGAKVPRMSAWQGGAYNWGQLGFGRGFGAYVFLGRMQSGSGRSQER